MATRLVELTDGQQIKVVKLSSVTATIHAVLKEGKNKFRRTFKHLVYHQAHKDQWITTDHELCKVLQDHDDGTLQLLLSNRQPQGRQDTERVIPATSSRGVSFVIGNEVDVEPAALAQLRHASELEGCIFALGMPDLHPGKGIPIGAVVMTDKSVAFPQLVDNDIGCGMSFVETCMARGRLNTNKATKIADSLESIDAPYSSVDEIKELCAKTLQWGGRIIQSMPVIQPDYHYQNLGTIGGGNHFAELQEFHEIMDPETIKRYGIDAEKVHLLVHSGSRSLGSSYLQEFCEEAARKSNSTSRHGHYAVDTKSDLFEKYFENHNIALNFAARNRQLIARRLLEQITGETDPVCKIDIYHNFLEPIEITDDGLLEQMAQDQGLFPKEVPTRLSPQGSQTRSGWIHRKGATPTTQSPLLVIPGSRGSLSYLVEVNQEAHWASGYSLAHGAGRRMNRSKALSFHQSRCPNAKRLLQTDLGGVVVCEKKDLIYEEAPTSYKDIDAVIGCLTRDIQALDGSGLVRILATLRPVLTYKYKDPYKKR